MLLGLANTALGLLWLLGPEPSEGVAAACALALALVQFLGPPALRWLRRRRRARQGP